MSVEASIDLRVICFSSKTVNSPIKILELLVSYGWSLQRDGRVFFKIDEELGWDIKTMSEKLLIEILKKKERDMEKIAIFITWQKTLVGGEVLFWYEKEMIEKNILTNMSFCLSSERQIFFDENGYEITDVNWYLRRLLPALNRDDCYVECFTYEENI